MTADINDKVQDHNRGLSTSVAIATAAMILALLAIGVAFISPDWLTSPGEYDVIGNYVLPQPVLETKIEQGGVVQTGPVVKCNLTDEVVTTTGELHFRRIDDGGTIVPGFEGSGSFAPGCYGNTEENKLRFFDNVLPPGVVPGLWIVEGSDVATASDGREDVEIWFTQQFEVVEVGNLE